MKRRIKANHIGWIMTAVIAMLGVLIGAPIEAVIILIAVGTVIEFAFLRDGSKEETK